VTIITKLHGKLKNFQHADNKSLDVRELIHVSDQETVFFNLVLATAPTDY